MTKGIFIVLDGPDGCGKTTQATRLVRKIQERTGHHPMHLRDPGGTHAGEKIRAILLDPELNLSTGMEVFLFMASRAQLVEQILAPALLEGKVVVCERWISSTIAYQGVAGGFGADKVAEIGKHATGGLVPDLLLVLDVPQEVATTRMQRSKDRIERKGKDYHGLVREGFSATLKLFPKSALIDATRQEEAVGDDIWARVEKLL
ncbi:MAG: dTMP kinase [Planctomycetes bacterium]|nr:dTMP kinase [Planctomycetota bacterium]